MYSQQESNLVTNSEIKTGLYRHYKGNDYQVIGTATHSETEELLVVYKPLYNDSGLWVRPLTMFLENVEVDGITMPRFQFLSDQH